MPDKLRQAIDLATRIHEHPEQVSDSDKLRNIANYLDVDDSKHGHTGKDAQVFLRGLALRLESSPVVPVTACECTWKWHQGKPCPVPAEVDGVRMSPPLCIQCLHICSGEEDDEKYSAEAKEKAR